MTAWTIAHLKNPATIPTFPPTTAANLGLTNDTTNAWSSPLVFTGSMGSGNDSNTGGGVVYPLYGLKSALVNNGGNSNRASSISQTATMALADVDPTDGRVHIRFAIAPVLENPGHSANQQPYFFVEVTNLTKSRQLFYTFNFSGQTGVPWQTVGGYQYTNWQTIDVGPGPGVLDVGDQVMVTIIASGCGPGGHEGHVYVDSGQGLTNLPGPGISAGGPNYTAAGNVVTYTYSYANSGTAPLTNTVVQVTSPQDNSSPTKNLQLVTASVPAACTATTGASQTVSCNFGTLNPGSGGTFSLQFTVPSPTTGPINHGNYSITGDGMSPVLGPLLQTQVTTLPLVDLSASLSDAQSSVTWGQILTYTAVVSNLGPNAVPAGASVSETVPSQLNNIVWTCSGSNGASCVAPSGSGAINDITTAAIPVNGALTYTIQAQASPAGSGPATINHVIQVVAPSSVQDAVLSNNLASDVNSVGDSQIQLTVTKSGGGTGHVSSVPAGLSCDVNCATTSANYPANSQVILYATAPSGSIFAGWSGGGCSGTANSCTVTLSTAQSVNADFEVPLNVGTVVGSNGTVNPTTTQPVVPGGTVSFTVIPSAGYAPAITDNCGSGGATAGGSLVGNTYTTNAIQQDCQVNFSFTNSGVVTVTPNVGSNGSVTPAAAKTVSSGGAVAFVVTANSGYYAAAPGGTCPAGGWSGNTYTIASVSADCSVNFTFNVGTSSVVTASVLSGSGVLTPSTQTISPGGTATVTLSPTAGYLASVDSSSTCNGSLSGNVYTVSNVTAPCSVNVAFLPVTYTVTASVLSGTGVVSPGSQSVVQGGNAIFDISSAPGLIATLASASTCTGSFDNAHAVFTVSNVSSACSAMFDFVPLTLAVPSLSPAALVLLVAALLLFASGPARAWFGIGRRP